MSDICNDTSQPIVVVSKNTVKVTSEMTLIISRETGYRYASNYNQLPDEGFIDIGDEMVRFQHGDVSILMDSVEAERIAGMIIDKHNADQAV
ncbi:MAG: hypothetical protein OQK82_09470 [Candidatus Pacearchaeota archaeon]|nr:hypothetical protein [Candidatus Pacearchaeota archaeon]